MDLAPQRIEVEAKPYRLLTYSNIGMFLDCPMKYFFRNEMKIVSLDRAKNLTIGSIYHDAIDTYFKKASRPVDTTVLEEVKRQIAMECAKNSSYLEDNEDIVIQGMLQGFIMRAASSEYKIMETETLFDIEYDEMFHRCGKIDAFLKNDKGQLFLGEWKSTASIDTYVKAMQTSNQPNNYFWAFEKKKFVGVIFRIARKSLLRQKKNESVEDFRSRIFDDYLNRPNENYHDETIWFDETKLKRWKHEVSQISELIKLFIKEQCWYRNTGTCWNYNNLCPYYKICNCTSPTEQQEIAKAHYMHCEPGEELFAVKQ